MTVCRGDLRKYSDVTQGQTRQNENHIENMQLRSQGLLISIETKNFERTHFLKKYLYVVCVCVCIFVSL